jgi:hypothetical protein
MSHSRTLSEVDARQQVSAEERREALSAVRREVEAGARGQVRALLGDEPGPEDLETLPVRDYLSTVSRLDEPPTRCGGCARLVNPRRDKSLPSDWRNTNRYRGPAFVAYLYIASPSARAGTSETASVVCASVPGVIEGDCVGLAGEPTRSLLAVLPPRGHKRATQMWPRCH